MKFSIVICGYNSYIECANKKLLKVLNRMFLNIKSENSTFIISNSYEMLEKIKRYKNKIRGLYAYDFSDLFNNIEIKDLKENILEMYNRYGDEYIDLSEFVSIGSSREFLYEGNKIYKQIQGILMGGRGVSVQYWATCI